MGERTREVGLSRSGFTSDGDVLRFRDPSTAGELRNDGLVELAIGCVVDALKAGLVYPSRDLLVAN